MSDPVIAADRGVAVRRRRTLLLGIALSLGAHLALLPLLFLAAGDPPAFSPATNDFDAIVIDLTPPPPPARPEPAPKPDPEPAPEPAEKASGPAAASPVVKPRPTPPPAPRTRVARPAPPNIETVVANPSPVPAAYVGLTDAELGGAVVAGSGSGPGSGNGTGDGSGGGAGSGAGGSCDMVRRIQDALRADPDIRQAALQAHRSMGSRRALLMWDGDWLASPGQVGRGLAGVRQAIALEIAFSPPTCREQSMRGFAVITLGDGPDSPRIALGAVRWRWSELAKGR